MDAFLAEHVDKRVVVVEMAAGAAVPTIRAKSECFGTEMKHATVIRINPRDPDIIAPNISLPAERWKG